MKALTKKEFEIIDFIRSYINSKGISPTYREIMHAFGLSSTASVYKHVKNLKEKGLLTSDAKRSRSFDLFFANEKPGSSEITAAPIIGSIAKGQGIELFAKIIPFHISSSMLKTDLAAYSFLVRDQSFTRDQIAKGDLLIVASSKTPENDNLVLANCSTRGTIIGRMFEEQIFLGSASSAEEPFNANRQSLTSKDNFSIQGIIIAQFRRWLNPISFQG